MKLIKDVTVENDAGNMTDMALKYSGTFCYETRINISTLPMCEGSKYYTFWPTCVPRCTHLADDGSGNVW